MVAGKPMGGMDTAQDTTVVRGATVNEAAVNPDGTASSTAANTVITPDGGRKGVKAILTFFISLIVVYFGYGYIANHSKSLKNDLQPRNIAANGHNILVIFLAYVIGANVVKLIAGKLSQVNNKTVAKAAAYAGTVLMP